MRFNLKTVSVLSAVMALGAVSVANANGTVKKSPTVKHHKPQTHHHVHQHVAHKPCHVVPECLYYQSGFYAGLQAGYSILRGKYKNEYNNATLATDLNKTLSNSGIVGEILLGGRYLWDNHVITGLEVSALVDSNRLRHNFIHPIPNLEVENFAPFSSQFRRKYAFVPSFILGYQFCQQWHAFLKLGASFSSFKIREDNLADRITFKTSKRKTAFMPGVGLEYALNCNVSFQGTFSYERYSKIRKTFQPILSDPSPFLAGNYYTVRVKHPQYYTLKFGVLVKV
jgi:opacity protein-like surface antigen